MCLIKIRHNAIGQGFVCGVPNWKFQQTVRQRKSARDFLLESDLRRKAIVSAYGTF